MKRNDMVLKIAECLVEPHFDDVMKEANYILKKLEKAGMLAPFYTIGYLFDYPNDGDKTPQQIHEWEPEND